MTTMDRLFQKGVLSRDKRGRRFYYATIRTRDEQIASHCRILVCDDAAQRQQVGRPGPQPLRGRRSKHDDHLLDDLEQLLKDRRHRLRPPTGHG